MLMGCTFFRMPSRVPLSISRVSGSGGPLPPAQYPFERVEERPLGLELREQALAILADEPIVQLAGQVSLVFRQQRPLHPFDDVFAARQDMRIDDQLDLLLAEAATIQ